MTLERYGLEHYQELGKKGGHPTWQAEIQSAKDAEARKKQAPKSLSLRVSIYLDEATAHKLEHLARLSGYSRPVLVKTMLRDALARIFDSKEAV